MRKNRASLRLALVGGGAQRDADGVAAVALGAERWGGGNTLGMAGFHYAQKRGLPWRFGLSAVMQFDGVDGAVPG
jgi:hypothetical protein